MSSMSPALRSSSYNRGHMVNMISETDDKDDGDISEDTDFEYNKVASRVAGVTLESDSLPEAPDASRTIRRKKRMIRRRHPMDVDPPTTSNPKQAGTSKQSMEWEDDDGAESHISSSSESEVDTVAREADDEQSDWVGYAAADSDFEPSSVDRRQRRVHPSTSSAHISQLQKKLERFALQSNRSEINIEFSLRERPNSAHFNRLLLHYRLEVVRRYRGNVIIRKKALNPIKPIEQSEASATSGEI